MGFLGGFEGILDVPGVFLNAAKEAVTGFGAIPGKLAGMKELEQVGRIAAPIALAYFAGPALMGGSGAGSTAFVGPGYAEAVGAGLATEAEAMAAANAMSSGGFMGALSNASKFQNLFGGTGKQQQAQKPLIYGISSPIVSGTKPVSQIHNENSSSTPPRYNQPVIQPISINNTYKESLLASILGEKKETPDLFGWRA